MTKKITQKLPATIEALVDTYCASALISPSWIPNTEYGGSFGGPGAVAFLAEKRMNDLQAIKTACEEANIPFKDAQKAIAEKEKQRAQKTR